MNVYFDNAATTPMDKTVLEKMLPYLENGFGNPSSIHKKGREIKSVIEKCRSKIASLLSCEPGEIFFTSGGTEADNMFILNTAIEKKLDTIITSKLEHHAVLHCCEYLERSYKKNIKFVDSDDKGVIDLDHLESLMKSSPNSLVTIMHGNNEIGNLNDIKKISRICEQYETIFHSDTVQTVGHYNLNLNDLNIHGIVGSAHKFHGPKGVGFLYLNNKHKISPFIHGGAQERNMRGGTENVYGIVGLAEALELSITNMADHAKKVSNLKKYMLEKLTHAVDGIKFNGQSSDLNNSLYTVLNVSIPNMNDQQMFLFNLDINNIAASAGSACTSGSEVGSHVLAQIKKNKGHVSVRFSFSKMNSKEEVDYTVDKVCEILKI
ncbi:MAG: cysteine desulfurase [Flammeovirgaceae bacterium]|nr:cysteine desulfurase [Flammeovirgaceae bacterium]|tara:strand:+ start:354 stop:1487 length:1134 start_codon:yes stop_codon:yes gene_type:complete